MNSRPAGAKRILGRAAFVTALMAGSLYAGAASALSFTFSFSGDGGPTDPATVTGTVSGLVDNTNNQKTGLTVTITSATNGPLTVFTASDYQAGDGFDVASGQVTGVNIGYVQGSASNSLTLYLGNQGDFFPAYSQVVNSMIVNDNADPRASSNSLLFTPSGPGPASVPGPLPLLGAGAAFGWSRRLRRKIKETV